ncbi:hypothetical protein NA56DRAFT_710147 [Hyaloscypha hepaticicola]|uniref:SAP domain-containing protein n=1 Tax=Hyaloscypha hepaticicola TaxID=2082293 RepID=A0A2J6PMF3_9HELO|nr:hypothetical protein NA56DRAFT_710147 [Hyaloscypha hepaticicola]
MSQREQYSPHSQSNHYCLPNYAKHTQQQLSTLCKSRGLSEMGHKHQLIQHLVVLFMKEYAEPKEGTMQGAWQFYTEKAKYLRKRMIETQGGVPHLKGSEAAATRRSKRLAGASGAPSKKVNSAKTTMNACNGD